MIVKSKEHKVTDLLSCYRDLASGEPLEVLSQKYVNVEVLVAQELFEKGVTLKELTEFITKRDSHVKAMLGKSDELWLAVRE